MRAAIRVLANIGTSPLGAWAGWSDTRPLADATIAHDTRIEREVAHAGEIIRLRADKREAPCPPFCSPHEAKRNAGQSRTRISRSLPSGAPTARPEGSIRATLAL